MLSTRFPKNIPPVTVKLLATLGKHKQSLLSPFCIGTGKNTSDTTKVKDGESPPHCSLYLSMDIY